DKDNWIQALKDNILRQIGRSNMTTVKIDDSRMTPLNFTQIIPTLFNSTSIADVTEKIRSYYPSCDTPSNMDQEVWQSDKVMNLFFNNFDRISEGKGFNIATATLRLYRIPSENSTKTAGASADCDGGASVEEDKLLRVSIYWYTKPARKKQVKRRLSDSKVIQENARWVELSVKPATRAWSRGHNLGLAVQVEDQEGNILKADRLFKGALCMVGASTPKPIPTIITDAARQSNELDQRIHSLLGRNTTTSLFGDIPMLPTIDICTLEFPDNNPRPAHIGNLRINACNLKRSYEHAQMLAERDKLERLATLPELLSNNRHIRHQRQHLKHADFDPRSKIVNKRILTSEEVQALNLNITTVDR
ncbi:TGFb propeptide domain containing protein, partial [Asbolus verrucosus]